MHMCGAGKGIWVRVRAGGSKPLPELEHGPRQGRFLEGPALRPPPPGLLQGNKSSHLTGFDARDHGFGTLSIPARIFIKIYIGAFRILLGACGSPLPERQKMAAMGALMAAATNADPAVVEAAGMEEPASKKAKGRGNAVDAAAAKVKSAQLALDVHQATVAAVEAMGSTAKQADRRKAERAKAQISKRKAELIGLVAGLEAKKAKAEATAARAAAQAAAAATREEATRAISDAGLGLFLEIRISYQSRFDNSSDSSDSSANVWARIKAEYDRKAQRDELPATDYGRSVEALQTIYRRHFGECKLWVAKAQRAILHSVVPADEVEDKVKEHYHHVATPKFLASGMCQRPMAQQASFRPSSAPAPAPPPLCPRSTPFPPHRRRPRPSS